MDITNELLAAYAEGKVTDEERNEIRSYLVKHPEELESVMIMMDEDYDILSENEIKEDNTNNLAGNDCLFSDLECNAAAFAPSIDSCDDNCMDVQVKEEFCKRLDNLFDELDK